MSCTGSPVWQRPRTGAWSGLPIAATPKAMREALAALLRIGGDSFTLDAINDTISGCGVNARVRETGKAGTVEVSFPKVPGIPPGFDEIQKIVEDIGPSAGTVPLLVSHLGPAGV